MKSSAAAIPLLLSSSCCCLAFGPPPLPSRLSQQYSYTSTASTSRAFTSISFHKHNDAHVAALFMTASSSDTAKEQGDVAKMKLGEVKAELQALKTSYSDCFDAESLRKRLADARAGAVLPDVDGSRSTSTITDDSSGDGAVKSEMTPTAESSSTTKDDSSSSDSKAPTSRSTTTFDREAVLSELRSLRVKELRTRMSERSIRWAGLLEKEDLVRALADAIEQASNFSPSGALEPGKVADINDVQLEAEVNKASEFGTPLLLDVYATWCGPCQMMAPQLSAAATELGLSARVAKIDSDKYPTWASKLRVGGLPTVLVFDKDGKEVNRVEGALMKDGLMDLVREHI